MFYPAHKNILYVGMLNLWSGSTFFPQFFVIFLYSTYICDRKGDKTSLCY